MVQALVISLMIKVESTKTLLVIVQNLIIDCEAELKMLATNPEIALLLVKTESLNVK